MKKRAAAALLTGTLAVTATATVAPASADTFPLNTGSSVIDVPVPDGLGPILSQILPGDINGIVGSAGGLLDTLNRIIATLTGAGDGSSGGTGGTGTVGSNGVASVNVQFGSSGHMLGPDLYRTGYQPTVRWEARDRSNAKITGKKCQIEVSFPGTQHATYKTAECSGSVYSSSPKYTTPGKYRIVVLDKVSGKSTTKSFTVE